MTAAATAAAATAASAAAATAAEFPLLNNVTTP